MHNLKEIRKDFVNFKKALEKRFVNIDFDKLENLDKENREFIQKKENLEKEKKIISKSKDKSLFIKSKEISSSIEKVIEQQLKVKNELKKILSNIPNVPHKDVPMGKDENYNIEINFKKELSEISKLSIFFKTLGFTYLNPHVYSDTVFFIGNFSKNFLLNDKIMFGVGASISSFIFFFTIGYLSKLFSKESLFVHQYATTFLACARSLVMFTFWNESRDFWSE